MDKLRLDLETLEVERLDVAVTGLNGGLEAFGMGHAATELGHSCTPNACSGATEACTEEFCEASCVDSSACEDAEG